MKDSLDMEDVLNRTVELRREFHAIPETAFKEFQTARRIAEILSQAGLHLKKSEPETAVLAEVQGFLRDGPTLMVRADIDGLQIEETTGLPFASGNGAMHACGHDAHIAIALTAAEILQRERERLRGRVVFVFQPAEETISGAMAMINDGLIEREKPDRVIGLHVWNQLGIGKIWINQGVVFASTDAFRVVIKGKGGHGALPHLTVDPISAAASFISASHSIMSRELPSSDNCVMTFGNLHAGSAPNVIPNSATIEGTVRTFSLEARDKILNALPRIASGTAEAAGASASFEILFDTPPVVNDKNIAQWVTSLAKETLGMSAVAEHEPVNVGDDMAEFLSRVPGVYFLLGASKAGAALHHNSNFDIDESCMPLGVSMFVRCTRDFLA